MSALAQEQSTAVQVPESAALARALPSDVLYQLEAAGQLATEILDERVIQWTEDGWSQRKIADELGCSQPAVSKRQARLGIAPSQPHKAPEESDNRVITFDGDSEVVDAELVTDESRELTPRPAGIGSQKMGQQSKLVSGIAEKARHIEELAPHLNLDAISSLPEEERIAWKQELSAARTVLNRVIAAL